VGRHVGGGEWGGVWWLRDSAHCADVGACVLLQTNKQCVVLLQLMCVVAAISEELLYLRSVQRGELCWAIGCVLHRRHRPRCKTSGPPSSAENMCWPGFMVCLQLYVALFCLGSLLQSWARHGQTVVGHIKPLAGCYVLGVARAWLTHTHCLCVTLCVLLGHTVC
jgi:hypothetical protein